MSNIWVPARSTETRQVDDIRQERFTQGHVDSVVYPARIADGRTVAGWWSTGLITPLDTWFDCWYALVDRIVHSSIYTPFAMATSITGVGDARLRLTGPSIDLVTDSIACPANTAVAAIFNWFHGLPVWDTTDVVLTLQGRVSASSMSVFIPYGGGFVFREPGGATATGI